MPDTKVLSDIEEIPNDQLIDFETIEKLGDYILRSPTDEVERVINQFSKSRPPSDIGTLLFMVGGMSEEGIERYPDHEKWYDYVNKLIMTANKIVNMAFFDPMNQETLQKLTDECSKSLLHEQNVIMNLRGNEKSALQFDFALLIMAMSAREDGDSDAFNYFWGLRQKILTWCF